MLDTSRNMASPQNQVRLRKVTSYIRNHFNEELHLEELAHRAVLSKYHFHRIFRETFGETLHGHIRRIRLEQAAFMLWDSGHDSITDVAYQCGFSSSQHFTRTFKAYYGLPPKMVRQGADPGDLFSQRIRQLNGRRKNNPCLPAEIRADGTFITLPVNMNKTREPDFFMALEVIERPPLRVASLRTQTDPDPDKLSNTMNTLLAWASANGHLAGEPLIFASIDFIPGSEGQIAYDASITVREGISADSDSRIRIHDITAGKYGVYHGKFQTADHAIQTIMTLSMGWWVSGYFPREPRPVQIIYYNNPDIHPSGSWIIDICFPITTRHTP